MSVTCTHCKGKGEVAKILAFGVVESTEDGDIVMKKCSRCRGTKLMADSKEVRAQHDKASAELFKLEELLAHNSEDSDRRAIYAVRVQLGQTAGAIIRDREGKNRHG